MVGQTRPGQADVIFNITEMRGSNNHHIFTSISTFTHQHQHRWNHHFYISRYFGLTVAISALLLWKEKISNDQHNDAWLILIFKIQTFDVNIKSLKFLWLSTEETFSPSLLCEKFLTNENYITLLCILTHCWDFRDWNKVNRLKTSLGKELRV